MCRSSMHKKRTDNNWWYRAASCVQQTDGSKIVQVRLMFASARDIFPNIGSGALRFLANVNHYFRCILGIAKRFERFAE
jgi:hypothetical protein